MDAFITIFTSSVSEETPAQIAEGDRLSREWLAQHPVRE